MGTVLSQEAKRQAAAEAEAAAAAAAAAVEDTAEAEAQRLEAERLAAEAAAKAKKLAEQISLINSHLAVRLSPEEIATIKTILDPSADFGDLLPIFNKCKPVIDNYIDKVDGLNHDNQRLETYKYEVQSPPKTHEEMITELETIYEKLSNLLSDTAMLLEKVETILVVNEFIRKGDNEEKLYLSELESAQTGKPYYTEQPEDNGKTNLITVPILSLDSGQINLQEGGEQKKMHRNK